ncbi:MAG TPA: hypothetical protein VFW38_08865 [Solirubrobacteraceae bacterium]|nr:hypothetical protein [Solirubrobacteraceae bacterium]
MRFRPQTLLAVVFALLLLSIPVSTAAAELTAAQAEERLSRATRLQENGFEAEARKVVLEVVQGSNVAIPKRLRSPEQRLGWWQNFLGRVGPVLRTALEIAIAIAIAIAGTLVVGLLIATGANALRLRFVRSARLEGFTGSSEATLGPLLSAGLGGALARMRDESPVRALSWQSGTEPKFELPSAVSDAVPQAALLAGLLQMIDKLLYRNLYVVSGTVHPPHEHRGAGITIVVANRSGRRSEQVTLWESEFMLKEAGTGAKEAVRYERLILPIAIWLAYRPMLGFKAKRKATLGFRARRKVPLGTRDWRSYALFALGELVPEAGKQRRLYELALDRDAANIGARLNLADLLMQRPAGQVPPAAEAAQIADGRSEGWQERLQEAGRHLSVVADSPAAKDQPIWFRARYMEAIRCMYLGDADAATEALAGLLAAMSAQPAKGPRLRGLVEAMQSPVKVLEGSIAVIREGQPTDLSWAQSTWMSYSGEYNLACLQARCAGRLAAGAERTQAVVASVRALRRAIERDPATAAEARVDPAFDPIRSEAAFVALIQQSPAPAAAESKPQRYEITLDPGPQWLQLAGAQPPQL